MPDLLAKVDAIARRLGQSRAAVINMAVYRLVEHGLTIEGLGRRSAPGGSRDLTGGWPGWMIAAGLKETRWASRSGNGKGGRDPAPGWA